MATFDHVVLLLSFVFGLALAHLLSRLGSLMLARARVRFAPLQGLMALNAVATVFVNWLILFDMHSARDWDLLSIALWFVCALSCFFICAAAAPDPVEDKEIDLEAFYRDGHRLFYWLVLLSEAVDVAVNFDFLKIDPKLMLQTQLDTIPFFLPPVLAIVVPQRWAQWTAGLSLLALYLWWALTFSGALK
jgi:hypothetical protein